MKKLSIKVARQIAQDYGCREVILLALLKNDRTHVVTYGNSVREAYEAADRGNQIKRWLGWPSHLCLALPRRVKNIIARRPNAQFVKAWKELAIPIYATGKSKGFYDGDFNVLEKIALMHEELGEATRGYRADLMDDKLPHRKMLEVELADCVIRIMNLASHLGLDVPTALVEKAEFNKTRPYKHSKKC